MKKEEVGAATSNYAQLIALFVLGLMFALASWLSSLPKDSVFPQWDKVVHAISGIALGVSVLPYGRKTWEIAAFVFVLAFLYEVVEFYVVPISEYGGRNGYLIDVFFDLLVAVLGAWIILKLIELRR